MEKVIVIAAHPDDEILGCGGVISKHILEGDFVVCLIMGTGITSRLNEDNNQSDALQELNQAARRAHKVLGTHELRLLDYPDNRFDEVPLLKLVHNIELIHREIQPTLVYTHHWSDVNIDHRLTCDAVMAATRSFPSQTVQEVRHFEVLSSTNWSFSSASTQFKPNLFVDVSDQMSSKNSALAAYFSEMRDYPHSRSLEAVDSLAKYRGSTIGVSHAEAFEVSRRLIK